MCISSSRARSRPGRLELRARRAGAVGRVSVPKKRSALRRRGRRARPASDASAGRSGRGRRGAGGQLPRNLKVLVGVERAGVVADGGLREAEQMHELVGQWPVARVATKLWIRGARGALHEASEVRGAQLKIERFGAPEHFVD